MKKIVKLTSLMLAVTFAVVAFAACGTTGKEPEKPFAMGLSHVDVYTYASDVLSPKLTGTAVGGNKVTFVNGRLVVDVAANVNEVEFDLAPFFTSNTYKAMKGKNFYFTRSDVKIPGGTDELVKGTAWVETTAGNATTRKYRPLGSETDTTVAEKTKAQIAAMPNGAVRMYILTAGTQAGKHVVYIDPTITSTLVPGTTAVDFTFYGHNGNNAELKVTVNKASA